MSTYRIDPHADPRRIRLRYNTDVALQPDGSLRLQHPTEKGYFTLSAPTAWQERDGRRVPVSVAFTQPTTREIGFTVGAYDPTLPLLIDPTYAWHTFHGSTNIDNASGIAVDSSGNIYVTGVSYAGWGAPLNPHSGSGDIVVLKLNSAGVRQWHTFHGSTNKDGGFGIAVDSSGNVYVTGYSDAGWGAPLNPHSGSYDIVVLKLSDADTTPNPFSFIDATGVPLSTVQLSNSIAVNGITAPAPIAVSGDASSQYAINGGAWTSAPGTVSNGDTVQVRHTSAATFSTAVHTILTIGGVSDTFTSTTLAEDTTPDPFAFVDQTGIALDTLIPLNTIVVTGINSAAPNDRRLRQQQLRIRHQRWRLDQYARDRDQRPDRPGPATLRRHPHHDHTCDPCHRRGLGYLQRHDAGRYHSPGSDVARRYYDLGDERRRSNRDLCRHSHRRHRRFHYSELTPVITWPTPADITYPTPLSGTQLNATADVGGSFAYTPGSGTVLNAGMSQLLSVTFTPTDTTNYHTASKTVTINVLQASSTTTVTCPASVTYNGAAQTPCSASVTGAGGLSLTPTPTYANNVNAGTATASYTYAGDANHTGSSNSKNFTINKADPTVTFTGAPATAPFGATFTVASTANSSSVPVYTASGACANVGPVYTIMRSAGTCTATVTWAADSNYNGATRSQTTTVENVPPPVLTVSIDIKPGSFPNSINPRSKGVIPVAILTTATIDATTVDPATVRFGRTGTEATPVQSALEDVDGDGDTDLILHFRTQATGIQCGDTAASLTGFMRGGQALQGTDSVNTTGCR